MGRFLFPTSIFLIPLLRKHEHALVSPGTLKTWDSDALGMYDSGLLFFSHTPCGCWSCELKGYSWMEVEAIMLREVRRKGIDREWCLLDVGWKLTHKNELVSLGKVIRRCLGSLGGGYTGDGIMYTWNSLIALYVSILININFLNKWRIHFE